MLKIRNLVAFQILIFGLSAFVGYRQASVRHLALPRLHIEAQKIQLRELLPRTTAPFIEKIDSRDFIYQTLADELPFAYQAKADLIAFTLISESNKYSLDPIFVLAVIETESHFNPLAHGRHGDVGLMQLLPKTGLWMAHRLKMKGNVDLQNPIVNIKIGAAYLAHLRQHFGPVGSRYLAAYNMGIHNVHKLLLRDKEPTIYARRVLKNYRELYLQLSALVPDETQVVAAN